jgi:uncharacterized protein
MSDLEPYLEELDQLLLDQGDDWMVLTQLDGYLAGVLVSPDPIPRETWLRPIWAGADGQGTLDFSDMAGFRHIIDLITQHYDATAAALCEPGRYEPLFDIDTNDEIFWEVWMEGFAQAMDLAPDGWRRIATGHDDQGRDALKGMVKLRDIAMGQTRLSRSKEQLWSEDAPDLIPAWLEILYVWRPDRSTPPPTKIGRNDPCPCGSGKKYKKCCGLAA